jgi:hypothetical protein
VVAHGVTFGVLALILGLIHVAPLQATPHTPTTATAGPGQGFARVHAVPWANVTIDGTDKGPTPFGKPFSLTAGNHQFVFTHPSFVPVQRSVDVPAGAEVNAQSVIVNFCDDGKPLGAPIASCGESP